MRCSARWPVRASGQGRACRRPNRWRSCRPCRPRPARRRASRAWGAATALPAGRLDDAARLLRPRSRLPRCQRQHRRTEGRTLRRRARLPRAGASGSSPVFHRRPRRLAARNCAVGECRTTGGTSIECVAAHMQQHASAAPSCSPTASVGRPGTHGGARPFRRRYSGSRSRPGYSLRTDLEAVYAILGATRERRKQS